jgi:DNA-binding MurR/RpiR family transcriptional regulator
MRALALSGLVRSRLAIETIGRRSLANAAARSAVAALALGDVRRARALARRCALTRVWRRALAVGGRLPRSLAFAGDPIWFYRLQRWFDVAVLDPAVDGWQARLASTDAVVLAFANGRSTSVQADAVLAAARELGVELIWLTPHDAAALDRPHDVRVLQVGGVDGLPTVP